MHLTPFNAFTPKTKICIVNSMQILFSAPNVATLPCWHYDGTLKKCSEVIGLSISLKLDKVVIFFFSFSY